MGRVFVHLHGKAKDSSFRTAISDYANRLTSDGVQIIEHRNQTDPGPYLDDIIKKAGKDLIILLQEKGENLDSIGYSDVQGVPICLGLNFFFRSEELSLGDMLQTHAQGRMIGNFRMISS